MRVGLIGAGNMARAMARGWGDPVLASDSGSGRAAALAQELGGQAACSLEVAREADLVVLCHKPHQLATVAAEIASEVTAVVSVLGGVGVAELQAAYPGVPVFRMEPNTPVEVRKGIICYSPAAGVDPAFEHAVVAQFERLGKVVRVTEALIGPATSVSAVGPAYMALVAEAQVEAAVRHGLKPDLAGSLAAETMAGTAALLQERGYDTLTVRREVTSPGGSTARGLDALERGGLRAAFSEAMDRVRRDDRMILVAASARTDVANYVSALFEVYIVLIFVYILLNMLFSFGLRAPYSRWSDAVLSFLRDVSEPYLRVFRKFIPPLGAFDLSPMIGIIVLYVAQSLLHTAIAG